MLSKSGKMLTKNSKMLAKSSQMVFITSRSGLVAHSRDSRGDLDMMVALVCMMGLKDQTWRGTRTFSFHDAIKPPECKQK